MLTINFNRGKAHRWLPAVTLFTLLAIQGNPKPAMASPSIGINVNGAVDWSGDNIYADAMKTSRDWTDLNGGHALTLDANGWPQQDAQDYIWAGSPSNMAGSYGLSFNGQATVTVALGSGTITGQVYNSGSNTTTATVNMNNGDLNLKFTNTIRTFGGAANTGVFNVKLMRPTVPGGSTPYAANVMFTTQEKALVAKFGTVRFMDWLCTNNNLSVNWSDRTLPSWASQQRFLGNTYSGQPMGSALELAVQLCNETGKDMWVNIPYGATDAYVTNVAKTILYGTDGVNPYSSTQGSPVWAPLNAGLKVYIEWSNELWNYQFNQSIANDQAAVAEVAHGGSPLNFDGDSSEFDVTQRRTAKRTVEISTDFRNVVGDAAMITRFRPVLESQQGDTGATAVNQAHMLEDYYNNASRVATPHPPSYYIWGGGGSAYYYPDNASTSLDINNIWTSQTMDVTQWAPLCQAETSYTLPFYGHRTAYEGGPSLDACGCSADAVKAQAWGDPRMTTLVTAHQTTWDQNGGTLLMYFNSVSGYSWGFTMDSSVLNTPKLAAIDQINGSAQAAATYGTVIPTTIAAGSYYSPETWSGVNVASMTATGNWTWTGYVVRNSSAGAFNIGLSAGSAGTTNQADVYVDGLLAGTITIPNSGSNTTYQNTSTVTSASLAAGAHGVLIKARSGSFGFQSVIITNGTGSVPGTPGTLTATSGNTQVALSWGAASGATSYNVYRGTTSGGESGTAIATGIATTSFTNTGLTNGTTYFYKVAGVNSTGTGAQGNEASATPASGVPGAPGTLTATAGNTQVALSWGAASGATSYTVYRGTASGGETSLVTGIATTTYTNTGLTNGTTYFYKVAGVNSTGTGAQSNEASATPASGTNAVTNPGYEAGALLPGWLSGGPSGISTSTPHSGTYCGYEGGQWASVFQNVTGLLASHAYTVTVWAKLSATTSQPIDIYVTNFGGTKTTSPITSTSWTQITVPFTTAAGNTGAQIGVEDANGSTITCFVDDWNLTSGGGSAPAAPTNLTATAGNAQAALAWTASSGATSYNVKRSTVNGSGYATVSSPTTTSYTNTGLTNGTTYYFVVTAVNASGESGNSNQASATPSGTNLVVNPGFETGALLNAWGSGGTTGISTTTPHAGTYCGYEAGAWSSVFQTVSGLTASHAYTVTVWAKLSAATSQPIDIYVTNFGGSKTTKPVTSTSWTQISVPFTTGSANTSAQIGVEDDNGSTITCFVDDWTLN